MAVEGFTAIQAHSVTAAHMRAIDHHLEHLCSVRGRLHAEPALGERDILQLVAKVIGADASSLDDFEPIADRGPKTALGS